jgi:hypothetical protein
MRKLLGGILFLLLAAVTSFFAFPSLRGWIFPPRYKSVEAFYMHAETTGLSDWILIDGEEKFLTGQESFTTVIFHKRSNPEAVSTLSYLTKNCRADGEFIFGSLPNFDSNIRQRIRIKGKIDETRRFDDGDEFKYYVLEDWFIETPVEVTKVVVDPHSSEQSSRKREVYDSKEAGCSDPRLAKYFRKAW